MGSLYQTFLSNQVLTSTAMQTLQNQAVIVCDSSADYPSVATEGMVVYDKALDAYLGYSGSTWVRLLGISATATQTWTPTVTQSAAVAATVVTARYVRQGVVVRCWANLAITGSGTSGSAIEVSLPVTVSTSHGAGDQFGVGTVYDSSAAKNFVSTVQMASTSTVQFKNDDSQNAAVGQAATHSAFALAPGDVIRFTADYLAA